MSQRGRIFALPAAAGAEVTIEVLYPIIRNLSSGGGFCARILYGCIKFF